MKQPWICFIMASKSLYRLKPTIQDGLFITEAIWIISSQYIGDGASLGAILALGILVIMMRLNPRI
jgi:hypothetical protein